MSQTGSQGSKRYWESSQNWSSQDRIRSRGFWARLVAFLRRAHQRFSRYATAVAMAEDGGRDLALELLEQVSVYPLPVGAGERPAGLRPPEEPRRRAS